MKNMKLFGLLLFGIFSMQLIAQDYKADDLLGTWLNEDKDGHVKIYKENGKYYGKLIWLKNPIDDETGKAKLDKHNDDEELQKRPLQDLLLLNDFVYDEDGEWEDGEIYDPKSGNTYSCYIEMKSMDEIKVRGYIGISLIGRTTYWTRVKK
jgi:uncharacterized protein (DUF2147 family)